MSEEKNQEKKQPKKKPSCHILRDRIGGVPKVPQELSREHSKIKRQIKKALGERPLTVPELFDATHIPIEKVFWHLMSLKKYGEIVEGEESESYVKYALKPKEEKSS
jgi:hypothetical protein